MFEPNKTVKVRLAFRNQRVEYVCTYFPAKEAYTYDNGWGHKTHYDAQEESWFVINGHWDVEFLGKETIKVVDTGKVIKIDKYVEFDMDIWEGSDPYYYDWDTFCEQAEKFYEKINSRRYLAYKEKFV